MTQIPPAQRRQQRTERRGMPPPKRKRKKSKATIFLSLIVCAAALALLVVICPWEPMSHATHSVGTADGNAQVGEHTNAYQGLRISEIIGFQSWQRARRYRRIPRLGGNLEQLGKRYGFGGRWPVGSR